MTVAQSSIWSELTGLIDRGGPIMWVLLALSILSAVLIFERCWFWIKTNNPWRTARFQQVRLDLRLGQVQRIRGLVDGDQTIYGRVVRQVLNEGTSEAVVAAILEAQRPRLERFMTTLGTIITAAPLLGILGTVLGLIASLSVLGEQETVTDLTRITGGIAEALLTTVGGLIVALLVLVPYNAFRTQIDRSLGRAEALIAAARRDVADDEPAEPDAST